MSFKEQLQKDQAVFYNADEFAVVATLSDSTTTITLIKSEDEEFGDVDHDIYRVKSSDRPLLTEGDILILNFIEREILTIEPIEMSQGLEHWLTFESRNI